MDEQSDEQLIARLSSEPEVAFRALYDRYASIMLRFVFRFTEDQQLAEDILHDVFSELLDGGFQRTDAGSLKSWLFTVAKNKSLNFLRGRSREVSVASIDLDAFDLPPEEGIAREMALHKLKSLEQSMPPELSETWLLRKRGLGYQEIANQLAIPLGTVKSRFSRLVVYLKEEFEK